MPLKFTDGSTASEVTVSSGLSTFGNLTSETRCIWCQVDTSPAATRILVTQGGGGPSNFVFILSGSVQLAFTRDYVTTDANAQATLANVNLTLGAPWFGAAVLDAGTPRLYGGTLQIPATEAAAYAVGPTAGVGGLVNKSANSVRFGGFSGNAQSLGGSIWWVAWFNWALSLSELRQVQCDPTLTRMAIGCWYPGQNGGKAVLDVSGRGNHGIVTGAFPGPYIESLPAPPLAPSPKRWGYLASRVDSLQWMSRQAAMKMNRRDVNLSY